jgi:NAD(P)-dependent dehydrogenase (short-subunit alcohol dehydrogenase family)
MNICVTGASQGLGEELCRQMASAGDRVWGSARSRDGLEKLKMELPSQFSATQVDVRDDAQICGWAKEMTDAGFIPDAVVLNASIRQDDMVESLDTAKAQDMIDTNLQGIFRCVEAFLPLFRQRRKGDFILIASTTAMRPSVLSASYSASKAGAAMAFRAMRIRYASEGIRFRVVYLGPVATPMWEGKKSRLVPSPKAVANRIARFVRRGGNTLYCPSLTTWLMRASLWLPDSVFSFVSNRVLK